MKINRWKHLGLQARIFLLLAALVLTTLIGGVMTVWHTDAIDSLITSLIDKNVTSYRAAEELRNALLEQKGFLTYYFLSGDPDWLEQLANYQRSFKGWLRIAQETAYNPTMKEILEQISVNYEKYIPARQQVIELYKAGQRETGAKLHWVVRQQFLELCDLCERYKMIHEQRIQEARGESRAQAQFINTLSLIVMPLVAVLGMLLGYILVKQILGPIRQLMAETGQADATPPEPDEVKALSRRVHSLIENVDQTQIKLERSQVHLLQSEKLALVGKLAAGVAHSIRNPLTSVKIRLFSLRRTLNLDPSQQEDLEVISEEIRHIDTIVRNFLEFSRPPKPKMQKVSPSEVVDQALQLLQHRLETYNVTIKLIRSRRLPEIWADPDQLKEVLVNLLVNACEAMGDGGLITITETEDFVETSGPVMIIQVSDNGPGIPESMHDKVFQPFYSSKEEGTGLGLSIAARIIQEHGGWIDLNSQEGQGTTFIINLPFRKLKHGNYLNR
ncbi:MAG: ATP-binding protein [Desulfobacca sp.]|nr:ATP-binding protein [Desulfobacca sp.]